LRTTSDPIIKTLQKQRTELELQLADTRELLKATDEKLKQQTLENLLLSDKLGEKVDLLITERDTSAMLRKEVLILKSDESGFDDIKKAELETMIGEMEINEAEKIDLQAQVGALRRELELVRRELELVKRSFVVEASDWKHRLLLGEMMVQYQKAYLRLAAECVDKYISFKTIRDIMSYVDNIEALQPVLATKLKKICEIFCNKMGIVGELGHNSINRALDKFYAVQQMRLPAAHPVGRSEFSETSLSKIIESYIGQSDQDWLKTEILPAALNVALHQNNLRDMLPK